MSPADNTPDFDSMSPEELMAWMETLAERQGATEGFTTDDRMEIDEVDPDTVGDTGPGYIPFGMTEEDWAEKQAKEEAEKAERLAAKEAAPAAPVAPEPVVETPAFEPVAEAAPAADGDQPDFDSMSPEELMAWMETLAERQGATEGFVSDARMEIAEIDPDTVGDTGPGYIPFGMSEEDWAEKQAKEEAEKAERLAARAQATPAAAVPEPEPGVETPLPEPVAEELAPEPEVPEFELPQLETEVENGSTEVAPVLEGTDMGWLDSLVPEEAASFPEVDLAGLDNLDFGDLGAELEALDLERIPGEPATGSTDPMDWLENLAGSQGVSASPTMDLPEAEAEEVIPEAAEIAAVSDPTEANVDPLEWLESLAQQEGASAEELMTEAGVEVPQQAGDPGREYTDYTVEGEEAPAFAAVDEMDDVPPPQDLTDSDDPAAWLDSLASSVGQPPQADADAVEAPPALSMDLDSPPESEEVLSKLDQGISDPEDMAAWMGAMLDEGAKRTDIPDYVEDDDEEAPAIEAQIPDWLVEQAGSSPPPDLLGDTVIETTEAPESAPSEEEGVPDWLSGEVEETPAVPAEMPDWLQEGAREEISAEIENIFVPSPAPHETEEAEPSTVLETSEIDTSDPWVEAFELERQAEAQGDMLPEWYTEKLGLEAEESAVPAPAASAAELADAGLTAESTLPAGELEAIPDWLAAAVPPTPEPVTEAAPAVEFVEPEAAEMPDWLKSEVGEPAAISEEGLPDWLQEAGIETSDEVPDWLLETIADEEPEPVFTPPPIELPPTPTPAATPPIASPVEAAVPVSPAPTPLAAIDVSETLQNARDKMGAGDFEEALADYEAVVHANAEINSVVQDLSALVKQERYKSNAALHRVLGDGLMRLGQLQAALDTYRRALNML